MPFELIMAAFAAAGVGLFRLALLSRWFLRSDKFHEELIPSVVCSCYAAGTVMFGFSFFCLLIVIGVIRV